MQPSKFTIVLFASVLALMFVGPDLTKGPAQAWKRDESQSALLMQQPGTPAAADVYLDTLLDVVALAGSQDLSIFGVGSQGDRNRRKLTLVSLSTMTSTASPCGGDPDNVVADPTSVKAGGYSNICSTSIGQQNNQCSVIQSTKVGACSIDQNSTGTSFCSAGPAGSPGANFPSPCSAIGNSNASTCSTNGSGSNDAVQLTCSVKGTPGTQAKNQTCSTSNGSGQTCSTGTNAGGSTQSNKGQQFTTCSTLSLSGGGNFCSVSGSGAAGSPNQCSADSSTTTTCTATTANTTDFCSVKAGQTNVTCTATSSRRGSRQLQRLRPGCGDAMQRTGQAGRYTGKVRHRSLQWFLIKKGGR